MKGKVSFLPNSYGAIMARSITLIFARVGVLAARCELGPSFLAQSLVFVLDLNMACLMTQYVDESLQVYD